MKKPKNATVKLNLTAVKSNLAAVKSSLTDVKPNLTAVKSSLTDVKTNLTAVKTSLTAVKITLLAATDRRCRKPTYAPHNTKVQMPDEACSPNKVQMSRDCHVDSYQIPLPENATW